MNSQPVVIERIFPSPIRKVWEAITNKNQMKQWYFDLKDFKPVVGFEFQFEVENKGVNFIHLCRVTEVVDGRKIVYSWRYQGQPGDSLVSFELFPEGENQTRLKLVHQGLETFPAVADYARENFNAGWTELIGGSLKKFLEKAA
jgi:uncharacterized protein YndB with AHSA1/START domain